MNETIARQVERVCKSNLSLNEKAEELVYVLGLSVEAARKAIERYKRTRRRENDVTFGVELEVYNCPIDEFLQLCHSRGIDIYNAGYSHEDQKTAFKIVSDASLVGIDSCEIVTPILSGRDGLNKLKAICGALSEIGAMVNRSCGCHVHIGAKDFTMKQWQNTLLNYGRIEFLIDSFMPKSRRNNQYCKSINFGGFEAMVRGARSVQDLQEGFGQDRYHKVNVMAYNRHKTIEFRQMSGTTDYQKLSMWLSFVKKLVKWSKSNVIENCMTIHDIPFLNNAEKTYFFNRHSQFANAEALG